MTPTSADALRCSVPTGRGNVPTCRDIARFQRAGPTTQNGAIIPATRTMYSQNQTKTRPRHGL